MSKKNQLLTTGYSGHDIDSFIEKLRTHDVQVVVDVRQNPISRKKGFSRTKLAEFLESNDLEYVHRSELGVPTELRKQLRDGEQELSNYLEMFREYLNDVGESLDSLYDLATKKRCCLICVEHRSDDCHRSVVAEAVAARNGHKVEIIHV